MKRKAYITGLICTAILFTGCSTQANDSKDELKNEMNQSNPNKDYTLTYSNLIDSKIKKEITNGLENAGIDKNYISKFIKQVDSYNESIKDIPDFQKYIIKNNIYQTNSNEIYAMEKWEGLSSPSEDYNCRLTSFELFKDYINSTGEFSGDRTSLLMDLDVIDNNPFANFSKEDENKFINLYASIPTKNTNSLQENVDTIKREFKNRNITFDKNKQASLINVYLHDPNTSDLFVNNSGILLNGSDNFLFIEKLSPSMPYQVCKFKNKKELYSYLTNRLNYSKTYKNNEIVIMENGEQMIF